MKLANVLILLSVMCSPPLSAEPLPPALNKYIVTLNDGISARDLETHQNWARHLHSRSSAFTAAGSAPAGGVKETFGFGPFHAYTGTFTADTASQLRRSPAVSSVEFDGPARPRTKRIDRGAQWGPQRMSQRERIYTAGYAFDDAADGDDMYAYVVDTGVRLDHVEFGGRAVLGVNLGEGMGQDAEDNVGHGTVMAGCIGGATSGMLKMVNIVAVKVANEEDFGAGDALRALVWAARHIQENGRERRAVVNFSIGLPQRGESGEQQGYEAARMLLTSMHAAGIVVVTAAGDDRELIVRNMPEAHPDVITVGSTDKWDAMDPDSNYGPLVDVFAPGVGIRGPGIMNANDMTEQSGSSVATAYISALALYYMRLYRLTTPQQVKGVIVAFSTRDRITGLPEGTPNRLAYNMGRGLSGRDIV